MINFNSYILKARCMPFKLVSNSYFNERADSERASNIAKMVANAGGRCLKYLMITYLSSNFINVFFL